MSEGHEQLAKLQEVIGYRFRDTALLQKAMTHSSLIPAGYRSYERLEFLGDAVVGLVVAEKLFGRPEQHSEGEMTEMKSAVVNRHSMAAAGRRLGLGEYLRVDRGLAERGEVPVSLVTDAYEALVGALFLDGGYDRAEEFVLRSLAPEMMAAQQQEHPPNFKSILQHLVQAEGTGAPTYRTATKVGPAHDRRFLAVVSVGGTERGAGWGKTKKDAEQEAANQALESLYPGWHRDAEHRRAPRNG